MCRDEAAELNKHVADLKQAGATRVVVIVKESIPGQLEEFQGFWPGEIFMDEAHAFYKALAGGVPRRFRMRDFLLSMVNPFSRSPAKANLQKMKSQNNLVGEGLIPGGLYVMRSTGVAELAFVEENAGDKCSIDQIIDAVEKASLIGGAKRA